MARERRISRSALAADAWWRLFRFFISTRAQRDKVLGRHGLTPNDIRALGSLDLEESRTMRSLAEEWGCDASNATWIVDRLEKRGFAARSTPASDRRVKRVRLTPRGRRTKLQVVRELSEPPAELLALDLAHLTALREALQGLPEPADDLARRGGRGGWLPPRANGADEPAKRGARRAVPGSARRPRRGKPGAAR